MKKTLISIIVPVYNVEKYISRCVESLIGQSYKNIEIILVDDGSTDESGMICEQYANKDNRIKVIHKKMEDYLMQEMLQFHYQKVSIYLLWIVMIGYLNFILRIYIMR
jgi:glycosyltransferase involved in cell wall biosynthesis